MMQSLGSYGALRCMESLFQQTLNSNEADIASWNIVLQSYAQHNRKADVLQKFEQMLKSCNSLLHLHYINS